MGTSQSLISIMSEKSKKGRHLGAVLGLGKGGKKYKKLVIKYDKKTFPLPFIYFFVKFLDISKNISK